jgi:peptidylprolyl isomerase
MQRSLLALMVIIPIALPIQAGDTDVVAQMGETSLSLSEFRKLTDRNSLVDPNPQERAKMIRAEIIRKAISGEARRQSFEKRPEVAAVMDRAAEQALVTAYMNSISRPPTDYPSEDQIKQAYEANKKVFTTQPQYHVNQIYIAGTDAKAAKQADDLYRQATRKKADFAEIARQFSQHKPSAEKGGDMGWLSDKELVPAVREALGGLGKGEIGKPVVGNQGYHILRLDERKASELLPLDKVRPSLIQSLRLRKAQEIEAAYLDAMLAKTPIAVNEIALGRLDKK